MNGFSCSVHLSNIHDKAKVAAHRDDKRDWPPEFKVFNIAEIQIEGEMVKWTANCYELTPIIVSDGHWMLNRSLFYKTPHQINATKLRCATWPQNQQATLHQKCRHRPFQMWCAKVNSPANAINATPISNHKLERPSRRLSKIISLEIITIQDRFPRKNTNIKHITKLK